MFPKKRQIKKISLTTHRGTRLTKHKRLQVVNLFTKELSTFSHLTLFIIRREKQKIRQRQPPGKRTGTGNLHNCKDIENN